jgi:hypothetical protein
VIGLLRREKGVQMKRSIVISTIVTGILGMGPLSSPSMALEPIHLPDPGHASTMSGTYFRMEVEGEGVFHFRRCTGLGREYAENPAVLEKFNPQATEEEFWNLLHYRNPTEIVCKRHLTRDLGIWNWHARLEPGVPPPLARVTITLFSRGAGMAWWQLDAWPSKVVYSVEGNRVIEEVELQTPSLHRSPISPPPLVPGQPGQQQFPIPQVPEIQPAPGYTTAPGSGAPAPGTQIEQSPGYVTGGGTSPLGAQPPDLSGRWVNDLGSEYHFSQDGTQISYHDPLLNLPVTGQVQGKTVTVHWQQGAAKMSVSGTVTSTDSSGRATRIEWENGFVFHR